MENAGGKPNRREKTTETVDLLRAYLERGDITARDRLIELYLPLVESFAHRYQGSEDYDDLFQAGCIGLINAVDRFDLERGGELAAFAVPNIVGEIKRHLRDRTTSVRMPRPVQELRARAVRCEVELGATLQRRPTSAEVAQELGVDKEDVERALSARRPVVEQDDASLPEGSRDELEVSDERLALASAFEVLNERDRQIVYLRFVRDRSRAEVARELGISERHLSRQTQQALTRLREQLERAGQATAPGLPSRPTPPGQRPRRRSRKISGRSPRSSDSVLDSGQTRVARNLPYDVSIVRDNANAEGREWTAHAEDLPGCEAHGDSVEAAVRGIDAAIEEWIEDALAKGREIPEPRLAASYSGRLMLRMPRSLHAELSRAAERDGVSLNHFIASSLEGGLAAGPRAVGGGSDEAAGDPEGMHGLFTRVPAFGSSGPRLLRLAVVVNLIVMLAAGVVAVTILIVASHQGW
jgi:RNA polymerase sigma-B factor